MPVSLVQCQFSTAIRKTRTRLLVTKFKMFPNYFVSQGQIIWLNGIPYIVQSQPVMGASNYPFGYWQMPLAVQNQPVIQSFPDNASNNSSNYVIPPVASQTGMLDLTHSAVNYAPARENFESADFGGMVGR